LYGSRTGKYEIYENEGIGIKRILDQDIDVHDDPGDKDKKENGNKGPTAAEFRRLISSPDSETRVDPCPTR